MAGMGAETAGALVISLDFELAWGVRDLYDTNHTYMLRVIQERKVIPQILNLFEEFDIAATWATVGFLFARTRSELQQFSPPVRPGYKNARLDPYLETIGEGEWDDPMHYAHQLIEQIRKKKRQEIATHTFSHYYCMEQGQTREAFMADIDSAISLAQHNGIQLKSIVFPRNQHNPEYDDILVSRGIVCYRGTEKHPVYRMGERKNSRLPHKRFYRLIDSYWDLSGSHLVSWQGMVKESGLCNIASSRYLRPVANASSLLSELRRKRIVTAMEEAAKTGKIFHLWTHPQGFGVSPEENLKGLQAILDHYKRFQKQYGMLSLSMAEAAERAKELGN